MEQLALLIVFISSIIGAVNRTLPSFYWFAFILHLGIILGIFVVVASDTVQTYHVAIVGYLACAVVVSSAIVNLQVYSPFPAHQAVAAGYILLLIVTVCFHFTRSD